MIVQCKKCLTRFKLDDGRVPEVGIKGKCSKCDHIFFIEKTPASLSGLLQDSNKKGELIQPQPLERAEGTFEEPSADWETGQKKDEEGEGETIQGTPSGPRRFVFKSLVVLLSVVGLAAGGFLVRDILPGASQLRGYFGLKALNGGEVAFSRLHTRGYYIDNAGVGTGYVIEGNAMHNASQAKRLIKVRGALFNSLGEKVKEEVVYGGNILSDNELQTLEPDQISACLSNPPESTSINPAVSPRKSIPFMIVFFDLPEDLKEFSVESADAGNPVK